MFINVLYFPEPIRSRGKPLRRTRHGASPSPWPALVLHAVTSLPGLVPPTAAGVLPTSPPPPSRTGEIL